MRAWIRDVGRPGWVLPALITGGVAAVGCALLATRGVIQAGDTGHYLAGAQGLIAGEGLEGIERAYPLYSAVLAVAVWTNGDLAAVALLQILVAAAGGWILYLLGARVSGPPAGLIAGALYLANFDLQRWHTYILTDSLFTSAVIVVMLLLILAVQRGGAFTIVAQCGGILAVGIRPNGWQLLAVTVGFILFELGRSPKTRWLFAATGVTGVMALAVFNPVSRERIGFGSPTEKMEQGVVIPGYPDGWHQMPPAESTLLLYASTYPSEVAGLMFERILTEFSAVRPFYSRVHNIAIGSLMLMTYSLAAVGLWRRRHSRLIQAASAIVLSQVVFVAIAFASYDGRFVSHIYPALAVLSGAGGAQIWEKILAIRTRGSVPPGSLDTGGSS